jgi:hypothetical protein
VSGSGADEGAWIAAVSLSEHRPGSVVMRASKVLAESGWSGGDWYRLLTTTPREVAVRLDELTIDTVILRKEETGGRPHYALLRRTLQSSPAWRECGSAGTLAAYCRVLPPSVPPKPLRMDLRNRIGTVIEE